MPARAAFLDRDGTIIYDRGPARTPADVELIPGVAVQLADLQRRGYLLIVITNQAGINRGQYSVIDFLKVNARMVQLLKEQGVKITSTLWCPHAPEQGFCRCRKPGGELFREARVKFNLDLKKSFMIGDKPSDVIPGIRSFTIKANTPQSWPLEGL